MGRIVKNTVLTVLLSSLFVACNQVQDRKVELKNDSDSISFAVGMLVSEKMPATMRELGIDEKTLQPFLQGVCDAFPVDDSPEALAYAQGVLMAASAMEMLDFADEAIYPDDTVNSVNRRMFLEGIVATAYATGKTMTMNEATEYYNRRIFRSNSEEFINKSKERPGVVVLPSGLQYKIEQMGNGAVAGYYDIVSCVYKGTYPNGALFDTTRGEAVELEVAALVPGFAEALMTLPAGTVCKLYIPWELAYGEAGTNVVPPYSALVYDLEIKAIVKK
ncbi:MAG: FKBP-type peptidyl-prolyl cis-trans isomerase [Bacteroidaceae bacterium]|nr:FKBP-type peptidyl-prolyl cis-trans isomerase [Bacteroidaceae bacterium]